MGHISHEPSMEEILSSIKRIIAEDGAKPRAADDAVPGADAQPFAPRPHDEAHDEDEPEVLELTEELPGAEDPPVFTPQPEPTPMLERIQADLVSTSAASASRHALASLSKLMVKPEPESDGTLEGLVREMLRPMLKDWLDANLPALVESMVAKEIERITGKAF